MFGHVDAGCSRRVMADGTAEAEDTHSGDKM